MPRLCRLRTIRDLWQYPAFSRSHYNHSMDRTYSVFSPSTHLLIALILTLHQDAIAALNTLQSNFSVVDAIRKSGKGMNQQAIPEMIEWCQKLGYEVCALPAVRAESVLKGRDYLDLRLQPAEAHSHCGHQRQRIDQCIHLVHSIAIPPVTRKP